VISESIEWTKRPDHPTIFVKGFNNTEKDSKLPQLVWDFNPEGATVQNIQIQRSKSGEFPTTLASRIPSTSFTFLKREYENEYSASRPATLLFKNSVDNNEEYTYFLVVTYLLNTVPTPFKDSVKVVVYGE